MSFEKTSLLRHPTIEKAYRAVDKKVGARKAMWQIKWAELYCRMADAPNPDVAAALLLADGAYREGYKISHAVGELSSFALDEGYDSKQYLGDTDRADIALSRLALNAYSTAKEIRRWGAFSFKYMQERVAQIEARIDVASRASDNPRLAAAAQTAAADMATALVARIDKTRADSVFSRSGLPADPLIEKVYEAERYHALKADPHVKPLERELTAARILLTDVDHVSPEMVAAALLHQIVGGERFDRIEYLYGARVAELHSVSASRLFALGCDDDVPRVQGADDLRAAFLVVAAQEWRELIKEKHVQREGYLFDIEEAARKARVLLQSGALSTRLAQRLEVEAQACETAVHAPENTAIRKPGTARPDRRW